MSESYAYSSDVAFTPAVKAIQTRKGSREAYAHVEARGGWRTEIDENLAAFLAEANSLLDADVDEWHRSLPWPRGGGGRHVAPEKCAEPSTPGRAGARARRVKSPRRRPDGTWSAC